MPANAPVPAPAPAPVTPFAAAPLGPSLSSPICITFAYAAVAVAYFLYFIGHSLVYVNGN